MTAARKRGMSGGWLANRGSLPDAGERRLVDLNIGSWNRMIGWLRELDSLKGVA